MDLGIEHSNQSCLSKRCKGDVLYKGQGTVKNKICTHAHTERRNNKKKSLLAKAL